MGEHLREDQSALFRGERQTKAEDYVKSFWSSFSRERYWEATRDRYLRKISNEKATTEDIIRIRHRRASAAPRALAAVDDQKLRRLQATGEKVLQHMARGRLGLPAHVLDREQNLLAVAAHRWAAVGPFAAMTVAHPVASSSPDRTVVCGAGRRHGPGGYWRRRGSRRAFGH